MVDLHTHTTFSDGTYSPQELIDYAKQKKISAIAITDHDTTDALKSLTGKIITGIDIVSGIEISADYSQTEFHILGLFIDPLNAALSDKMLYLREKRKKRNYLVLQKLNENGISITMDEIKKVSAGKIITRAHFARVMINKGYARDNAECFKKYLGKKGIAYVKRQVPSVKEAVELIHCAQGIAALAHPFSYGLDDFEIERSVREFKKFGIDGIESYYCTHTPKQTGYLLSLCRRYDILPSGGSDFHGGNKPGLDLGIGYGELNVGYEVYKNLKERYGKNKWNI